MTYCNGRILGRRRSAERVAKGGGQGCFQSVAEVMYGSQNLGKSVPTKLTMKTATQIATPSDQPLSSLCDFTAAPMMVDTCTYFTLSCAYKA